MHHPAPSLPRSTVPVFFSRTNRTVTTKDFRFQPPELTVKARTTVIWENQESRQNHGVWFKSVGGEPGQYFFPGETVQRRFDQPGDYPYVCQPHQDRGMNGVIYVTE